MLLNIKRTSLLTCIALGILVLGAGLASAAGKPTSVSITSTHEINGYTVVELTAKVNPNGASTSTVIELLEVGASTWREGETHTLSGTTVRSYSEEFQVSPGTSYEARVKAKNLYGITESAIVTFSIGIGTTGGKSLKNVPYGSEGMANFVWKYVGYQYSVTCNESSWGYIGNPGGKGDVYHFSMYGCSLLRDGKSISECKVSNFTTVLEGPTLKVASATNVIAIPTSPTCGAPGSSFDIAPEPFRVVDNGGAEYTKNRSFTLTATGVFAGFNPAEITIESTWYLTGAYFNTPFAIGLIGL